MAKRPKSNPESSPAEPQASTVRENVSASSGRGSLLAHGWVMLTVWISLGLLLEGLVGYRVPEYLGVPLRRELFRLGHVHGALLSLVVIVAGQMTREGLVLSRSTSLALRVGSVVMPLGFLLGGVIVFKDDPNPAVLLAPVGGVLVLFGIVSVALQTYHRRREFDRAE